MIKVEQLSFSYGKKEVLNDISFTVKKGTIATILGQNGCGKSTLLSLLTKNLKSKAGAIYLKENNIKQISLRQFARKAAVVNQYNTAPESLTVRQLVAYGRIPYAHTKEWEDNDIQIEKALEATSLSGLQNEQVNSLSGGQMQRVWIAMAIAQNTEVLFLDEPTTYLDVHHQVELMRLIYSLKEEYDLTVIMILHDINQAIYYSDQIIALKDGKVAYDGDSEGFLTKERIKEVYGMDLKVLTNGSEKWIMAV